jgi:hypothetical protein
VAVLGLKENWQQFSLLVLINAFVGGMVGLNKNIYIFKIIRNF